MTDLPAWAWWGGGLAGAAALALIAWRFLGPRIGAIVFAVLGGLAVWRGSLAKAKRQGAAARDEQIQRETEKAARDAAAARARQAELNREQDGVINEADPNLRDPRR